MPDFAFLPAPLDAALEWADLCEAAYAVFRDQIRDGGLAIGGAPIKVTLKMVDGKEEGFWHVVTRDDLRAAGGPAKVLRTPDKVRASRVPWIPALITNYQADGVNWFVDLHGSGFYRHYIWCQEKQHVVVLQELKGALLLITSFVVDKDHLKYQLSKRKLAAEKAKAKAEAKK
jgi:hypothetical protein